MRNNFILSHYIWGLFVTRLQITDMESLHVPFPLFRMIPQSRPSFFSHTGLLFTFQNPDPVSFSCLPRVWASPLSSGKFYYEANLGYSFFLSPSLAVNDNSNSFKAHKNPMRKMLPLSISSPHRDCALNHHGIWPLSRI